MKNFIELLSVAVIAFVACLYTACSESSTACESDEDEVFAEQEISDETYADVSSSSRKSGVSSSSDVEEAEDSEDESTDDEKTVSSSSEDESTDDEKTVSSSSEDESTDDEKTVSSSSEEKEPASLKDEKCKKFSGGVSGVSQKGPFVKGTSVTIQELDGETLNQTGRSFKGKIKSDKGDFSVVGVSLSSQYALLEASGYYRNEITGKKSLGVITLNAITDLSNRETVNINLLTHLEYERVVNLVKEEGLSIAKAKAQAEKEIFSAFGIDGDFAKSEDLNIFKSGDGNAALLAISILTQGDLDAAGLTERMTDLANAFAENGVWEDADMKASIADWASEVGVSGGYTKIRKNIEDWKIGGEVPDFEKYVKNFWWSNYGLGECTKEREGEIGEVKNEKSKNYCEKSPVRYICVDENWQEASDVEKDTYNWGSGDVDDIKAGNVNENVKYIYDGKEWREATELEALVGGVCLESRKDEIRKGYICKNGQWTEATDYDYDVEGMECVEGGTVVGKKTFMQYVCREGEFVEPYKMRTWFGGRGSAQIHHSLVKNSSTYWYFFTDVNDGLKSRIEWLDGAEDGGAEASLKRCNGICGKVVFDDSKEDNIIPYAALAFDFDMHGHEYDASELDGLCVAYSASDKITLKMNFSDSHADDVGYALPEYVLPASAEVSVKRIPWASFVAPDWYKGDTEDYGVNGAKSLAGIKVQFDRDESSMMTFNIKAIGPYNGNCEDYVKFENK